MKVLYFGPMGCQNRFFTCLYAMWFRKEKKFLKTVKRYFWQKTIKTRRRSFGASEIECGNYKTLNLDCAKKACREYLEAIRDINDIITYDDVNQRGC